jgi:phosphoenolpyruvate---glycerone phosphotransferase subunit DhaL
MSRIDVAAVRRIAARLEAVMIEHRDRLLELDREVGDGDLGLTMTRASAAAAEAAAADEPTPGRLFMRVGMAMAKAAPSTMGTLVATGFMRGGKAVATEDGLGAAELARFFRAFVEGILERGRARLGEKTVADALAPAAAALEAASASGLDIAAALQAAALAADQGRDAAKGMMAQHGKAAVFREQTVGVEDPGAYAGALIIRAFHEVVAAAEP